MFRFFKRKRSKQPQRQKNNSPDGQQPKQPKYQTHSREPARLQQHLKQPQYRTTSPTPTEKTLKELSEKIHQLEKTLEKLSGGEKSGFQNRVTIQNLTMKEPVLKELAFELDRLKLDEVSGALNLGNNFGVEVGQNPNQNQKPKQNREADTKENHDESGFKKTGDGFQFRFGELD